MKKLISSNYGQALLVGLELALSLSINTLFLLIPPPVSITKMLFDFHIGVALLLIIFLSLVFGRRGILWDSLSLTLVLLLFSIPLIYKWQTGEFRGYLIGGLLPWSDAQGYYSGAQQLIHFGYLTAWASRRPLFGGFLAVLLTITGNHLQSTLALMTMVNGISTFLAAREIQRKHGALSAALFVTICYLYYCTHSGRTASEQLGFCLGLLGMAFLIRVIGKDSSINAAAYGLFLLTLALNVRAGAFFTLPVLALWMIIYYKKIVNWKKPVIFSLVAITLGMLANILMLKAIGSPKAAPFSNFSYTLYGLASGNQGWTQVMKDYPNVKEDAVFNLAVQKIKNNPYLLFAGILGSYHDYFTLSQGQFSFMIKIHDPNNVGNRVLWILTWIAVVLAFFKRKDGQHSLILAILLGVLLSVSFVPPSDADFMRVYAATIPMSAYVVSTSITFHQRTNNNEWISSDLLLPFSIILLALGLVGPLLVKALPHSQIFHDPLICPSGTEEIVILTNPTASIEIVPNRQISESYAPKIKIMDFRRGTRLSPIQSDVLLNLGPNQFLSIGEFQKGNTANPGMLQTAYLITPGNLLKPGPHHICATSVLDNQLTDFFYYYEPNSNEIASMKPSILQGKSSLVNLIRQVYIFSCLLIFVIALLRDPSTRFFKYLFSKKI